MHTNTRPPSPHALTVVRLRSHRMAPKLGSLREKRGPSIERQRGAIRYKSLLPYPTRLRTIRLNLAPPTSRKNANMTSFTAMYPVDISESDSLIGFLSEGQNSRNSGRQVPTNLNGGGCREREQTQRSEERGRETANKKTKLASVDSESTSWRSCQLLLKICTGWPIPSVPILCCFSITLFIPFP